ncbi:MAG: hypothetical protein K6T51_08245 [Rubrobacteraceae bacterium]|nr:hypothetical protein [Rubrobacteraceae bacterium]MCL6438589.1 hypothetical protein [Rubrobacteraceae bacterium]
MVYGRVEEITLHGRGHPPFGNSGPPGCNPSDGCVAPGLGSQIGNIYNNPQHRP